MFVLVNYNDSQRGRLNITKYSRKGLGKLGNIVSETLLQTQTFPILAARKTCVARKQILRLGSKEMFLNQFKNILLHRGKFCFRNVCFPV